MTTKYHVIRYSDEWSTTEGFYSTVTEAAQHLDGAGDEILRWEKGWEQELNEVEKQELDAFFKKRL
jgi:hypothetical protein